ncbi:MAG: carbonyl reductase 1 [Bacillariaceae sp.]|jgi:carbonyl reductase 1
MVPLSRVAVVTGANKGIGYFIALQLAVSGLFTDVIIGCRDSSRGAIASEEIQQKISAGSSSSSTKIHSLPLIIGNVQSHTEFCERLEQEFGSASVLVNSAGFAYKGSDPTPFKEQTKKTFETNYYGLIDFTEKMIPLLKKGTDPRLVNVASMAGRLTQLSSELQTKYTDEQLTIEQLNSLMKSFEKDVHDGVHRQKGWSSSNYGRLYF